MEISGYYQPQVNAVYDAVSYEALIRPNGAQTTEEYIETIKDRTNFDLSVVTYFIERLRYSSISLPISFNVFANSFYDQKFIDMCEKYKGHLDFSLEVTEHEPVLNLSKAKEAMQYLNNLGIEFSLDDYGKGYSNEQRLRSLPFTEVKFDKSLIQPIVNNFSSFKNLKEQVNKFRDLGVKRIVYEGIENPITEALVLECDEHAILQGYYYSKLRSINDFNSKLTGTNDRI